MNATGTDGDNTSIQIQLCSSTSRPTNVLQADKDGIWGKSFIVVDVGKIAKLISN